VAWACSPGAAGALLRLKQRCQKNVLKKRKLTEKVVGKKKGARPIDTGINNPPKPWMSIRRQIGSRPSLDRCAGL
jgi:hypothetical protein